MCEGYSDQLSKSGKKSVLRATCRLPLAPSLSIHSTEQENRYFMVFVEQSAYELSGYFDSSLWTRTIPQEAHSIPAIMHAMIALGALRKSLDSAPSPDLKVNIIQSVDKTHHEVALLQHLAAIKALHDYISATINPQLRTVLLACLLFICFETFSGNSSSAIQHIYSGLKMLRSYYSEKSGSRPWKSAPKAPPDSMPSKDASIAFEGWLECNSGSKEGLIPSVVQEYLENLMMEHNPDSDVDGRIKSDSIESMHSDLHPQSAETIKLARGKENIHEDDDARSPGNYSMFLGLGSGEIEEPPSEEDQKSSDNQSDTSISQSTTTREKFKSYRGLDHVRESSIFSTSSEVTSVTHTTLSTAPFAESSPYQAQGGKFPGSPTAHSASSLALPDSCGPNFAHQNSEPILRTDLPIEDILIQTFVRLEGNDLFFGITPGIPPLDWDVHRAWSLPVPSSFEDFASAQRCWDFLMGSALQFYRRVCFNQAYAPSTMDPPAETEHQYGLYLQQLIEFSAAFQPFLDNAMSPDRATISNPAALIISIYLYLVQILLARVLSDSETVYDTFLPNFKYIVSTCSKLISSQPSTQLPRNPRFSFEFGIVPALHFTVIKCREPYVRRAATDLLFGSPRQEGMWDGILSARIGRWVTTIEEEGLTLVSLPSIGNPEVVDEGVEAEKQGGTIIVPEENRVRLAMVDWHISDRYMKVRCHKVITSPHGSREERETIVAW